MEAMEHKVQSASSSEDKDLNLFRVRIPETNASYLTISCLSPLTPIPLHFSSAASELPVGLAKRAEKSGDLARSFAFCSRVFI